MDIDSSQTLLGLNGSFLFTAAIVLRILSFRQRGFIFQSSEIYCGTGSCRGCGSVGRQLCFLRSAIDEGEIT
jgi:hypothetical protein